MFSRFPFKRRQLARMEEERIQKDQVQNIRAAIVQRDIASDREKADEELAAAEKRLRNQEEVIRWIEFERRILNDDRSRNGN